MTKHPIVHVEFAANDPSASAKFYGDLFEWPITSAPEFDYYMFDTQAGVGGGFPRINPEHGYKAGDVVIYVDTDDIEASLARAVSLGATDVEPKSEVPGMGWMAFFKDPGGNRVGLWKAAPRPAG
jgi:predicted enzyme related to lactoylglutathione lyase